MVSMQLKNLIKEFPDAKVIMLSIHDDESYVSHALKTGALGYMLKEMDADAIVQAIKVVALAVRTFIRK